MCATCSNAAPRVLQASTKGVNASFLCSISTAVFGSGIVVCIYNTQHVKKYIYIMRMLLLICYIMYYNSGMQQQPEASISLTTEAMNRGKAYYCKAKVVSVCYSITCVMYINICYCHYECHCFSRYCSAWYEYLQSICTGTAPAPGIIYIAQCYTE
jgi:uncharacterized ion transporter superfamily protein YfcC